jgi:hypothetical protein
MEMGGQAIGKLIIPTAARVGGQVIGRLTGIGTTPVKEAFKSGEQATGNVLKSQTTFDKAMRGEINGQEVVDIAKNALNRIKDTRSAEYQAHLANLTSGGNLPAITGQGVTAHQIDVKPIADKMKQLMAQYNIKLGIGPKGNVIVNADRVGMGKKGISDIEEIIEKVGSWGRDPEDFTVKGLDTLKRQLDDFYSDSSQARAFVTSMRNTVKDTIVKAVPEYDVMTKGYSEATQLIKDIESNLMMRKQGMSGRIVSDQTLRRLMSAMKDNFELRGELVQALTAQGGEDVVGAVAGHSMNTWLPRGLAGTGPALLGNVVLAKLVHPAFWPVVAASSPRVSGEFLRMLGKTYAETRGVPEALGKAIWYGASREDEEVIRPPNSQRRK